MSEPNELKPCPLADEIRTIRFAFPDKERWDMIEGLADRVRAETAQLRADLDKAREEIASLTDPNNDAEECDLCKQLTAERDTLAARVLELEAEVARLQPRDKDALCKAGIHSTDIRGKCFICGAQAHPETQRNSPAELGKETPNPTTQMNTVTYYCEPEEFAELASGVRAFLKLDTNKVNAAATLGPDDLVRIINAMDPNFAIQRMVGACVPVEHFIIVSLMTMETVPADLMNAAEAKIRSFENRATLISERAQARDAYILRVFFALWDEILKANLKLPDELREEVKALVEEAQTNKRFITPDEKMLYAIGSDLKQFIQEHPLAAGQNAGLWSAKIRDVVSTIGVYWSLAHAPQKPT